jgi:hypothetical protein
MSKLEISECLNNLELHVESSPLMSAQDSIGHPSCFYKLITTPKNQISGHWDVSSITFIRDKICLFLIMVRSYRL